MKKRKSLYFHIVIAFISILVFTLFLTSFYFTYARNYVTKFIGNQTVMSINSEEKRIIVNELLSGVLEALGISLIIGILFVAIVARHIISPIEKINNATKNVARGDFTVNLETKREDEIGELTRNFNKMVKELGNIDYLNKEFISNLSHEFKTPIASIQGFAKLLKDGNTTDEEKKEYIQIILEESERLVNLSNNIQLLSKLDNKSDIPYKEVAIDEQIRKSIIMMNSKLDDKNIDISMNDKSIKINGNEDMLQQVWINLINNAIKYTNENGKIEIILDSTKDKVTIEVKDNGIGIAKEKQEKIFEKFYQTDVSHASEGNGLGLAIVKKIVDSHGGNIILESELGKGSSFKVELPK